MNYFHLEEIAFHGCFEKYDGLMSTGDNTNTYFYDTL